MKLTKTHPLFNTFLGLTCSLSPENLTCDGELSRAEVNQRYNKLTRQWKEAEQKAGFAVTEDDVYAAHASR